MINHCYELDKLVRGPVTPIAYGALSLGRIIEDDKLICVYHGLTFDKEGTYVHVPGQPSTRGIRVRA